MFELNEKNPDFKHVGDTVRSNSYYDIDFNFKKTELFGTDALDQSIENVLMTEYGERLFNFKFGSPLQFVLFQSNTNADTMKERVYNAIEALVPVRIDRSKADVGMVNNNPHILYITLDYSTTDGNVVGHHFQRKFRL